MGGWRTRERRRIAAADSGSPGAVAGSAFGVEVAGVDDHAAAGYHMIRY